MRLHDFRESLMLQVLALSASFWSATIQAGELTLDEARQASQSPAVMPRTMQISGTYEVHRQNDDDDDEERLLWSKGTFSLSVDGPKLLLDVKPSIQMVRVLMLDQPDEARVVNSPDDRIVILRDGKDVTRIRFTPRINSSGCQIELYSDLRTALNYSQFPLKDPVHPHLGVLNFDKLIENLGPEEIEWSAQTSTLYRGKYNLKNSNQVFAVFEVDATNGGLLLSQQVFNRPSIHPAISEKITWSETDEIQYVKKYWRQQHRAATDVSAFTEFVEVVFDLPSMNEDIPEEVFSEASLEIPSNARTFDRRTK